MYVNTEILKVVGEGGGGVPGATCSHVSQVKDLRDSEPRDRWREVKQLCRASRPTGRDLKSLFHPDLACKDAAIADNIKQAFVSVMKNYYPLTNCVHVDMEDEQLIFVTELSVARKLGEIKTSRACGPDDLHNWVLKEFAEVLAAPIADISRYLVL